MYEINVRNDYPILHFAADELKKYLRMMLPEGGDIPIGRGEGGFRIGLLSEQSDDDTVVIDTSETGGEILGSNPGAVLIAVYRYLRLCGCRWLFPGEDGDWTRCRRLRIATRRIIAIAGSATRARKASTPCWKPLIFRRSWP